jgi:hypothetical protein
MALLPQTAPADSTVRIAFSAGPPSKGNPHVGGAGARPWYCDEDIQQVIFETEVTMDLDRRRVLAEQIIRHYLDQASTLILFPIVGLDGIHRRVTHWEPWNDILNFHLVNIDSN